MKKLNCLCVLCSALCASGAHANWQYPGTYIGEGHYIDSGARFVVSVRGGATYAMGTIENKIGSLVEDYYDTLDTDIYLGSADLGTLPAVNNLDGITYSAGVGIGLTLPGIPQWRLEASWDHMGEIEYNTYPLYHGSVILEGGGEWNGEQVDLTSGDVRSTLTTDVLGVMAYYDFFEGLQKPIGKFIPYIGFGIGYADSTTVLNMTDLSGYSLVPTYGTVDQYTDLITFYESTYSTSNIAGMLALGFSYGLTENVLFDFSARMTYIPGVKFTLSNEDGTQHRDWFAAENLMYFNIMAGLRFEF